jgi:plasmid maintenance system antidote protein VapI
MASCLGCFFGNSPAIWLNLQQPRDLWGVLHMDVSAYEKIEPLEMTA